MEITKELKKKLLGANSEEEVKALLGDQATEAECSRAWREIQKSQAMEAVDDDELASVSGGFYGIFSDKAPDGYDADCWFCFHSKHECARSEHPDGYHHFEIKYTSAQKILKCKYCGYTDIYDA